MSTKEDLLLDLTIKELRQLAKENRIKLVKDGWLGISTYSVSKKEEIIDILLESPRITKKKILAIIEPPPKPRRVPEDKVSKKVKRGREIAGKVISVEKVQLTQVLKEVKNFKAHVPSIRGKRKEKQYTLALTGYLAHSFPQIEMEQPLGKGNRIDAIIGNIGIEAKYRPDQNEINRLYGQIDTYLQFLEDIIVIFFDSDSSTVNDFKKKLKRGGYSEKVSVVNI